MFSRSRTLSSAILALALAATACAPRAVSPQAQRTILTLDVAPNRRPCQGEAPRRCLVVRREGDTTWTNFFDPIEGFTHEDGVRYRLRVERTVVAHPPADGSAYRYRLVQVLLRAPPDTGRRPPLTDRGTARRPRVPPPAA